MVVNRFLRLHFFLRWSSPRIMGTLTVTLDPIGNPVLSRYAKKKKPIPNMKFLIGRKGSQPLLICPGRRLLFHPLPNHLTRAKETS